MKVYRGPSTKPFSDNSHEFVSQITPGQLEKGIRSKSLIQFNITKEGLERQAVCTAQFEDADIIPMISGLLANLSGSQECLAKIQKIMSDKEPTDEVKVKAIKAALRSLKKQLTTHQS